MVKNRIDILITADDRATGHIKKFEKQTLKSSKNVQKSFTDIAIKAGAIVVAFRAVSRVAGSFVDAASKVQQLQVRLTVLTGTVQKGNELFEDMANLAAKVSFTYDDIMESAVNLRAVVKGGNEEVVKLMPVILDLAATTGLGVQETTSQMIRMYSAGAGAADLFRERGVLAMLGFEAGVSVSAEDTIDRVMEAWEDADSRFRGATDGLAETWQGRLSMMEDAWFDFRSTVAEGFLDSDAPNILTTALKFWTEKIKEAKVETAEYTDLLDDMNTKLELVNELIDANMKQQSAPFLLNRNEVESEFNDLLVQRSRLLATMHSLKRQEAEDVPEVDKAVEEAEEIILIEQNKLSIIESMHDSLSRKIIEFRNKEFKNDQEKTKAKKKLQQEILNSQMANLETFLAKQGEENKVAAIAFKAIQTGKTVINTAEAISEASPNPILMAFAAAVGAAQLATIASVGFAKGTDTVPSMLTPGEMVVPRDFAGAIREGRLTLGGPGASGNSGGGDINIFIQGGINPGGSSVDEMAEELGFAFEREVRTARGF